MSRAHVRTVIINSEDPERLVRFWASLLDVEVRERDAEAAIVWLAPDEPGGVNIGIQRVEATAASAGVLHLDIEVDELAGAQERIEQLGGTLSATHRLGNGFEWRVMQDPDGNPFCIFVA
jgi:predicted enzyme related to lactoylglutathione lyase